MGIMVTLPDMDGIMVSEIKKMEDAILYNLAYIGERCVTEARTGHTYTDRTGNLTSSMGYVLVKDGQIIRQSSFESLSTDGTGSKTGESFARSMSAEYPSGVVLIVVAGMNYARCVADRGFDVLQKAEILAEKLVPQILEQIGFERR